MEISLYIDNVPMKEPFPLIITRNKIWNSNSGRTQKGTFTGDIVARKFKLDVTWTNCSKLEEILNALSPSFISVTFLNPNTQASETKTFYSGDETLDVYSYVIDDVTYSTISVSLVEK